MSTGRSLIPRSMRNMMNFPLMRMPTLFDMMNEEGEEGWNLNALLSQTGLEISEDESQYLIKADMPGMKEENIQITIESGILRIQGERTQEESDKALRFHSRAISSYNYRLALPGPIDENQQPKACYKDGVLCITFNKAKQNIAKRIQIQK